MIKIVSRILVSIENRYCRFWAERYYTKHSGINQKNPSETKTKKTNQNGNNKQ